ncbi:putative membrane protein [Oopsacas minuta]|uniref:Membrane protein n=1 Tax=Oopsacas minuta TaxID=111878 RepID=A0AAV7K1C2_9METZ|nr:putative membrane protein [Oopsacas minuta]
MNARLSSLKACPRVWGRVAGLSGAFAVALGAYAAHSHSISPENKELVLSANKYHFISSLALLALSTSTNTHPLCGCLITVGTVMFCGSLYLKGFFDIPTMFIPPIGGVIMLFGWLSIAVL